MLRSGYTLQTFAALFPNLEGSASSSFTKRLLIDSGKEEKMKAVKLFVTLCLFCPVAVSQERQRPSQYVLAPKDNTLITVAAQYQCPLRIEEVQLLLNIDVSWDFLFRYQVRNTGTKAIKSYRIAFLTLQATGGTINDGSARLRICFTATLCMSAARRSQQTYLCYWLR